MGLYVSFCIDDFENYPAEVVGTDARGKEQYVEVDYSGACEAFVETFLDVALGLVPIDTGYLKSTIDADTDGYFCWAEATAEYAQYVEYGTWCMQEQPYFRPALEQAMAIFHELAQTAVSEAEEILGNLLQSAMTAFQNTFGFFQGTLMAVGAFILLFPILVNLYALIDSTLGVLTGKTDKAMAEWGIPDIIIT